jgi:RNA polymerase II C-terminal domain phosphatase-like 3/4
MADNEDSTLVPNEDQEEGEISEEDDHIEEEDDPGETKEVTDLPVRDDFIPRGRRTEANYPSSHFRNGLGIEDDELEGGTTNVWSGGDGNPWGRDPIAAFRPPGNIYAPNMYNFAWAQAVQGGRSVEDDDDDDVGDAAASAGSQALLHERHSDDPDSGDEGGRSLTEAVGDMTLGFAESQRLYYKPAFARIASWNASPLDLESKSAQIEREWRAVKEGLEERYPSFNSRRGSSDRDSERDIMKTPRGLRGRLGPRRRERKYSARREVISDEAGDWKKRTTLHSEVSIDDSLAKGGAPPPSEESKSAKQSSTDEIPAADDREEGELEEGEIELPSQALPKSSTSSKEQSEDHRGDETEEDKSSEGFAQGGQLNDLGGRAPSRSKRQAHSGHSRNAARETSTRHNPEHNNNMPSRDRDTERERQEQLSQVGILVKNVTVKDAQKSFISICHRLNKAVMSMNNLVEERKPAVKGRTQGELPRDVSNLVNKTFQGIRAVYAVWSTASGKEQDQDKDTFPRSDSFNFVSMLLLGLVNWSDSTLLPCTADCWSLLIVLVQNFSHQNKYASCESSWTRSQRLLGRQGLKELTSTSSKCQNPHLRVCRRGS